MTYNIRIAKDEKDMQTIAGLAEKIWHFTYDPLLGKDQVNYMLAQYQSADAIRQAINHDQYIYYVAETDGNTAGFCGIRPEKTQIFVSKIYIDPLYQKQGIARSFFDTVIDFAHAHDRSTLYLTVNKENQNAISVYRHFGFEITEDVVTDIGGGYVMDDYIMKCHI